MIQVYSKDSCAQCVMTKNFLNAKGVDFEVKMLDTDFTREDIEAKFAALGIPMARSFPMVFEGDKFIGGMNETKIHIASK